MSTTTYIEKLSRIEKDEYQKAAFESQSNTVVLAGPGSGKTTVLTLKAMHLLNSVIAEPRGLACLTYSREAAREFTERLKELGLVRGNNIFLGTVHSFCLTEILGKFSDVYSLNIPTPIRIASEKQRTQLFETAKKNVECDNKYFKIERMNCTRMLSVSGVSNISVDRDKIAEIIADEYEKIENVEFLPEAEQASPLFLGSSMQSGINSGSGAFFYPNIGSIVWGFFENEDINRPVYFASTLGSDATKGIYNDLKDSNSGKIRIRTSSSTLDIDMNTEESLLKVSGTSGDNSVSLSISKDCGVSISSSVGNVKIDAENVSIKARSVLSLESDNIVNVTSGNDVVVKGMSKVSLIGMTAGILVKGIREKFFR